MNINNNSDSSYVIGSNFLLPSEFTSNNNTVESSDMSSILEAVPGFEAQVSLLNKRMDNNWLWNIPELVENEKTHNSAAVEKQDVIRSTIENFEVNLSKPYKRIDDTIWLSCDYDGVATKKVANSDSSNHSLDIRNSDVTCIQNEGNTSDILSPKMHSKDTCKKKSNKLPKWPLIKFHDEENKAIFKILQDEIALISPEDRLDKLSFSKKVTEKIRKTTGIQLRDGAVYAHLNGCKKGCIARVNKALGIGKIGTHTVRTPLFRFHDKKNKAVFEILEKEISEIKSEDRPDKLNFSIEIADKISKLTGIQVEARSVYSHLRRCKHGCVVRYNNALGLSPDEKKVNSTSAEVAENNTDVILPQSERINVIRKKISKKISRSRGLNFHEERNQAILGIILEEITKINPKCIPTKSGFCRDVTEKIKKITNVVLLPDSVRNHLRQCKQGCAEAFNKATNC